MLQPNRREPLKVGRRISVTITLDPEAYALLAAMATAEDTNRSALLEQMILKRAKRTGTEIATPA